MKKYKDLTPEERRAYHEAHRYSDKAYTLKKRREEYQWYKAHGICVECHHERARPGKTMCEACAEKDNARKREKCKKK